MGFPREFHSNGTSNSRAISPIPIPIEPKSYFHFNGIFLQKFHSNGTSHSPVISSIPIPIVAKKLLSLPWDSHGNSILMGLLIPMSLVPFPFHSSQRDIPIPIVAKKLLSFPWDSLREFHSNETFHSHVISPIPIPIVAKAISILTGPISIENPVPTHTHCETSDVSLPFQPHDITALRPVPKSTA